GRKGGGLARPHRPVDHALDRVTDESIARDGGKRRARDRHEFELRLDPRARIPTLLGRTEGGVEIERAADRAERRCEIDVVAEIESHERGLRARRGRVGRGEQGTLAGGGEEEGTTWRGEQGAAL